MKRALIVVILGLNGCSSNTISNADIKSALDQYHEKKHLGCLELNVTLPTTLNSMQQKYFLGSELDAYVKAGLLTAAPEGKLKRYELKPKGKDSYIEVDVKAIGLTIRQVKHGAICVGDFIADEIKNVTQAADTQRYLVSYTYRLENKKEWLTPDLKSVLPKAFAMLEGEHKTVFKRVLIKSSDGLAVEEINF
jgi:hypothetical protein